jgi:hypothetical protein
MRHRGQRPEPIPGITYLPNSIQAPRICLVCTYLHR